MSVKIVSGSPVFQNVLFSVCIARGLAISGIYDSYRKLTRVELRDILLLHVIEGRGDFADQVLCLTQVFPGIRIIVLCPQRIMHELLPRIGDMVTALIPETESADMLFSVLYLAQRGYRMTPADQRVARDQTRCEATSRLDGQACHGETAAPGPVPDDRPVYQLSRRELAILVHLCSGNSNKSIANALQISDATVKVHLRMAFRKIGVTNRTQAAMWAAKHL
ncbi:LuxR C-terminal-related transcriptional regulator [Paracoccaceae bacterium Fryx2]|nr:LuxR C-terminal-related transcriptional regulator [Paracoccaceae bacterium Fryx2]